MHSPFAAWCQQVAAAPAGGTETAAGAVIVLDWSTTQRACSPVVPEPLQEAEGRPCRRRRCPHTAPRSRRTLQLAPWSSCRCGLQGTEGHRSSSGEQWDSALLLPAVCAQVTSNGLQSAQTGWGDKGSAAAVHLRRW
jgi:hypothetical protein